MSYPRPYVVRDGDYLFGLACRFGFDAEEVWDHPKNAELKLLRGGEMNLLHPGDLLFIPDSQVAELPLEAGASNSFRAELRTVRIRVQFVVSGKPLRGLAFARDPGCTEESDDKTDGDGYATLVVPTYLRTVWVRFAEPLLEYRLRIGSLNPVETVSGQIQRLTSLGCYQPLPLIDPDLDVEESTALALGRAIAAFQEHQGLPITAEMDPPTARALVDAHGS